MQAERLPYSPVSHRKARREVSSWGAQGSLPQQPAVLTARAPASLLLPLWGLWFFLLASQKLLGTYMFHKMGRPSNTVLSPSYSLLQVFWEKGSSVVVWSLRVSGGFANL